MNNIKTDYRTWSDETFKITQDFVYEGITEYTLPSDTYIANGIKIAEKQLALGGYRLAYLLENMWGATTVPEE